MITDPGVLRPAEDGELKLVALHPGVEPADVQEATGWELRIAGALEAIGDRWTMLVIRDAFLGVRRFDDFQRDLGIARNVLTDRLNRLVEEGILEKRAYQDRPQRFEYRLTDKGVDLWPVLVSLMKWGDRHSLADAGQPTLILHRDCGGEVDERFRCERCGAEVDARSSEAMPGPGARRRWPTAAL